jgi:hypothetical protein
MRREPEAREPIGDLDDTGDFADEHNDLAVDDEQRGGPEHTTEDESPKGYGGADV